MSFRDSLIDMSYSRIIQIPKPHDFQFDFLKIKLSKTKSDAISFSKDKILVHTGLNIESYIESAGEVEIELGVDCEITFRNMGNGTYFKLMQVVYIDDVQVIRGEITMDELILISID